ncbi:response regulator [Butyrivibrio sp. CB08]|uniref:response regulator transcription factor n=1 Tax=Butyrivibrio sp. CB08 TaxID=2364879 RepID=UPI000EA9BCCB|nr:response regulator [Butyrivibrio sp. CB08]RKM59990.1 response regulator [Butyrivibrio sp. CB08]
MYRLLIVDDEPLVQIGLKSMLAKELADKIEVIGTASNGQEAWDMISMDPPDIVIADIRMPVMTGLELLNKSHNKYGTVPAFIMLTAYEEFEMARQALIGEAVDYLVKIELNPATLTKAINKAIQRIDELKPQTSQKEGSSESSLEDLRQKFMVKLFNHLAGSEEEFLSEAGRLNLSFDYNRYIVVYGEIHSGNQSEGADSSFTQAALDVYSSSISMAKEIISRHAPCQIVSIDIQHFAIVFMFNEDEPVAGTMDLITEALENARTMISSYFKAEITFGIGSAVSAPLDIAVSFDEAKTAAQQTDASQPVRLFSHIVGSNRRSGKDKLITAIQEYIDSNLNGKLQLNEVAEVFGLSPAYLSVLFKKTTESGFSEYVNTKKIDRAKEMLLSGDMKIYEVADALGFESAYYFSKVFKKVDGHSPREYIQSKSDM